MRVGLGPSAFSSGRRTMTSFGHKNKQRKPHNVVMLLVRCLMILLVVYVVVLIRYQRSRGSHQNQTKTIRKPRPPTNTGIDSCVFRTYPPRRYYHKDESPLPDFLSKAEYIYGELPTLLPTKPNTSAKLCVNQAEWRQDTTTWPFADGTNPSLIRLQNNPQLKHQNWMAQLPSGAAYLATICMTNSQCAWKDSKLEQEQYHLSTLTEPTTVRTVLLVLNESFETLQEATITTYIDAQFGRRVRPKLQADGKTYQTRTFALDDARLFTYRGDLWVSYREGRNFGYEKQVLNKIHIEHSGDQQPLQLTARLMASETETLCCGRNMALMDNVRNHQLQALTWVDPITVESVEMNKSKTARRLAEVDDHDAGAQGSETEFQDIDPGLPPLQHGRRLKEAKKKSDFHGTNGFMVHLPHTNEYLGIGHFHRPPGRNANDYARFGHHYTHAFFTIPDTEPFHLKRLSAELLLPSYAHPEDAEIIQFWSGLERASDETLVLAYGVNDCEGAGVYVDLSIVESLLRDVPQGKEVVDLMGPLHTG